MVHNDPLVITNLLHQADKLIRRPLSPIRLIDTVEFALAEFLSKAIHVKDQDHLSVIYFSQNFTKIFFMKGPKIEDVLPTIHTGSKSATICETAFSKILYEFDFKGIDAPKTLILAGEIAQVNAEFFFREKFPDLDIVSLEPEETLLAPDLKNMAGNVSPYTTAIALAMKNLLPKKVRKYKSNFVPRRIKEKQSQFVIAWHGFAAIGLILLTMLFLYAQNISINNEIHQTQNSLNKINQELTLLGDVEHKVDSLRLEITNIETGASLIDSLASATTRWTPLIEDFSNAFNDLGFFYVNQFVSSTNKTAVIELDLSNLAQVALLERYINDSKVLKVKDTKTEQAEELLQLTIECDLSNQYLNEKHVKLSDISDSTAVEDNKNIK